MDLYFQRHDGQAVTCEDFRNAMADANGQDLSAFEAWWVSALLLFLTLASMLATYLIDAYLCHVSHISDAWCQVQASRYATREGCGIIQRSRPHIYHKGNPTYAGDARSDREGPRADPSGRRPLGP